MKKFPIFLLYLDIIFVSGKEVTCYVSLVGPRCCIVSVFFLHLLHLVAQRKH